MKQITLGNTTITSNSAPYVIAEIGVNHEGSLERALELIELAKAGGADAAKFQSYKAETLASRHSPAYWDTSEEPTLSQYELFKKYDRFNEQEYRLLAEHCCNVGIDFLSTPFDAASVEFLDPLMSAYKIASADLTNVPLLRNIAVKAKPVILSTGASTLSEIERAVDELYKYGCPQVALLHCVLNYPTLYENANLSMIRSLQDHFPEDIVGYSDHTLPDPGMQTLTTAYLLGARIIEKHFTHDKTLPGNDHYHAMDVHDLRQFRQNLRFIERTLGNSTKAPLDTEAPARKNARRSIVIAHSLQPGQCIEERHLTYKRPGTGISPRYWDDVIGRNARRNLESDHVLQWEDIE